jgi:hypothetical protein
MKSGVNQRFIMLTKKAAVEDVGPCVILHTRSNTIPSTAHSESFVDTRKRGTTPHPKC